MKTPTTAWTAAAWIAVLAAGCTAVEPPRPAWDFSGPFRKMAAVKAPRPPVEDISPKRKERNEAAVRRFEQNRDFAEYQAAVFSRQQGDDAACVEGLRRLLKRNPEHRESRLLLAEVLTEQRKADEAVRELGPLVEKRPLDAEVQHAMGLALDADGQDAAAVGYYERAVVLAPGNEVFRASYEAAAAAGGPSRSRALAIEGAQAGPRQSPDSATGLFPGSPAAQRAAARRAAAQRATAEQLTEGLAARGAPDLPDQTGPLPPDPATTPVVPPDPSRRLPPIGSAGHAECEDSAADDGGAVATAHTESAGEAVPAASHPRRAAPSTGDDPQVPIAAATAALRANEPETAVRVAEEAVRRFPKSAALYRVLAAAHYRRGDYAASQVAAQQALSLDNSSALSYFLVGSAMARLGQADAAEAHLRQARRLDPRYGQTR